MSAARLYILLMSVPEPSMGEDEDRGEVYPHFVFARSRRRAVNHFRHVFRNEEYGIPPECVHHVPPSRMTAKDTAMLAIFGPSKIRGQTFEMRVERARLSMGLAA